MSSPRPSSPSSLICGICNKKAVIYARYSSHKQREESIEKQLEICHKFAEDNDYEVIAEYYSAELSEKIIRGMRKNILKGTANGSYRPYGYDIVENKYVVNPYEAEIEISSKKETLRSPKPRL